MAATLGFDDSSPSTESVMICLAKIRSIPFKVSIPPCSLKAIRTGRMIWTEDRSLDRVGSTSISWTVCSMIIQ